MCYCDRWREHLTVDVTVDVQDEDERYEKEEAGEDDDDDEIAEERPQGELWDFDASIDRPFGFSALNVEWLSTWSF